jgi:hypothetical protein
MVLPPRLVTSWYILLELEIMVVVSTTRNRCRMWLSTCYGGESMITILENRAMIGEG